jgi:hypothetical protein
VVPRRIQTERRRRQRLASTLFDEGSNLDVIPQRLHVTRDEALGYLTSGSKWRSWGPPNAPKELGQTLHALKRPAPAEARWPGTRAGMSGALYPVDKI